MQLDFKKLVVLWVKVFRKDLQGVYEFAKELGSTLDLPVNVLQDLKPFLASE